MKKIDRKRLRLEREAVRVLVAISAADLRRAQGGHTDSECDGCSYPETGCPKSTVP